MAFSDLREFLGHTGSEIVQALDSLWLGRVVLCARRGRPPPSNRGPIEPFDWIDSDEISLNAAFSSKRLRVPLSSLLRRVPSAEAEQQRDSKETHALVETERKLLIQATIVRVMKARKTLPYQQLEVEVFTQVRARFTPNPAMVRKNVETLIEREYLRRDESSDQERYEYLP